MSLVRVLLRDRLSHLLTNTPAGTRFANTTRQAMTLAQRCPHRTPVIVYAGGYYAICEPLTFVHVVLGRAQPVQERLRLWLDEHLKHIEKRE